MADVLVVATQELRQAPTEVFDLFGSGEGGSWLFDAQCDSIRTGAPVALRIPSTGLGDGTVDVLGRFGRIVAGHLIEIVHDQPWAGRLRVVIRPGASGGSLVSVSGEVDQRGMDWLMRRRGWPVSAQADAGVHRIGLLTSKSGPGAVFSVASEYMAELAVEEINADGGLGGRPVELIVGDDQTDAEHAAREGRRLVAAGCRAVVASVTSASFSAVVSTLNGTGRPVIHSLLNEGGAGTGDVLRWGERPLDQVRAAAPTVMRNSEGKRWYMIGNDYRWAHGAHLAGERALSEVGATIVGNQFVPIGTENFESTLDGIERSGADCVLSTLIGADEVAFERQTAAAGFRSRWQTLSLVLEESARERIGDQASQGIWTALGYFEALDTPENIELVGRYRGTYGPLAPPLSSLSESVYEAFLLYAAAVRRSRGDDASITSMLRSSSGRMPRGAIKSEGPHRMHQELYVARAGTGGFQIQNG